METFSSNLSNTLFKIAQSPQNTQESRQYTGSPRLNVLQKDTISFSASRKRSKEKQSVTKSEPLSLTDIANKLVRRHEQEANTTFTEFCRTIFSDYVEGRDYVIPDLKRPAKIENKAIRWAKDPNKIDIKEVEELTTDLARTRLITDGSEKATDGVMEKLADAIKAGTVTITEIRNYHGVKPETKAEKQAPVPLSMESGNGSAFRSWAPSPGNIQPYLSKPTKTLLLDAQTEVLEQAGKPAPLKVYQGVGRESAGYTGLHILGKTINGLRFEIKQEGNHVWTVDKATKVLHEIDIIKKAIQRKSTEKNPVINVNTIIENSEKFKALSAPNQNRLRPVIEAYLAISDKGYGKLRRSHDRYVFESYKAGREAEILRHSSFKFPTFPKMFNEIIKLENLLELSEHLHLA